MNCSWDQRISNENLFDRQFFRAENCTSNRQLYFVPKNTECSNDQFEKLDHLEQCRSIPNESELLRLNYYNPLDTRCEPRPPTVFADWRLGTCFDDQVKCWDRVWNINTSARQNEPIPGCQNTCLRDCIGG